MEENPRLPTRMPDLPEPIRLFLAGIRDEELENLRLMATLRPDERAKLRYMVNHFTMDDLEVIGDHLENLRSMKRFGRFGLWLFGFVVAGAGAAGVIKTFFTPGGPK